METLLSSDLNPTPTVGLSADGGNVLAVTRSFGEGNSRTMLKVISFETGQTTKEVPLPGASNTPVALPSGKEIAFLLYDRGVSNIWLQPLDGSSAKQWSQFRLNHETSSSIRNFAWSPDGKHIVVAHASVRGDVVILKDQAQ